MCMFEFHAYCLMLSLNIHSTVIKNQNNVGEMRKLVCTALRALHENRHDHIGSSGLWNGHVLATNRMVAKLKKFRVKEVSSCQL